MSLGGGGGGGMSTPYKCADQCILTYSLFEKATASVGYDFFSHPVWDKYIEWEEAKGYKTNVVRILDKLITIPLHQYARFFEKYVR